MKSNGGNIYVREVDRLRIYMNECERLNSSILDCLKSYGWLIQNKLQVSPFVIIKMENLLKETIKYVDHTNKDSSVNDIKSWHQFQSLLEREHLMRLIIVKLKKENL